MRRIAILVEPASYLSSNPRLFVALEALYPVKFLADSNEDGHAKGALLVGTPRAEAQSRANRGLSCLLVSSTDEPGRGKPRCIRFADSDVLPPFLRNRKVTERRATAQLTDLRPTDGDTVIASHDGAPVWIHRPAAADGASFQATAVPLPVLGPATVLHQHVNRDQFMGMLPLLHFLRSLLGTLDWSAPPLRACLVLDDVNLKRETYGCIDFRALARSARDRGYHASIALIPLDAGRVAPKAAAIFREYSRQLSILIHGNNHIYFELARRFAAARRIAMLAEARRRMIDLSDRLQLPVCRVAEPPYGVFLGSFVPALIGLGYEAVVCTIRHYLRYNPAFAESLTFGMRPVETLPRGLAMIPRIPAAVGWETDAVLAALLGQPIVIAGHHFDADNKLRHIEEMVDYVNGFGPVEWCNPSRIASSQYLTQRDGTHFRIRTGSRQVVVSLPDGIETVEIERPWLRPEDQEVLHWGGPEGMATSMEYGRLAGPLQVRDRALTITSPPSLLVDPRQVPACATSPWPIVRRALSETRDRLYPYLPSSYRRSSQLPGSRE